MVATAKEKFALITDKLLFHPGMKSNGILRKRTVHGLQIYILALTGLAWILGVPGLMEYGLLVLATAVLAMTGYGLSRREGKEWIIFGGLLIMMTLTAYFTLALGGLIRSGGLILAGPVLVILSLALEKQNWTNWLLVMLGALILVAALFPGIPKEGEALTREQNLLFICLNFLLLITLLGLLANKLYGMHAYTRALKDERQSERIFLLHSKSRMIGEFTAVMEKRLYRILEAAEQEAIRKNGTDGNAIYEIRREGSALMRHLAIQQELAEVESRTVRIRKVQSDFIKYSRHIAKELSNAHGDMQVIHSSTINQFNLDFDPRVMTRIIQYLVADCCRRSATASSIHLDISRQQENSWKDLLEINITCHGAALEEEMKEALLQPVKIKFDEIAGEKGPYAAQMLIAGELVRILDGRVFVKSRDGKKTTFRILLPAHNSTRFVGYEDLQKMIRLDLSLFQGNSMNPLADLATFRHLN